MHTGKRQQTRHTRTQLPAGAIVANLASSAHALYALCIRCLHANRQLPFQAFYFYFWSNYHQVLRNHDEASYCLAKVSSSKNVTSTPLVALAARRSRRARSRRGRTTGHQLQSVDRFERNQSSAISRPIALIASKELGNYWSLEGSGSRQGSKWENSWLARTTSESMGSVHSSPALSNKARTPTGRHTVYRHSLKPTALIDSQQPADRPPPC